MPDRLTENVSSPKIIHISREHAVGGTSGRYDPTLDLTCVVACHESHDSDAVDEERRRRDDARPGVRDGRGTSRRAASRYYSRHRRVSRSLGASRGRATGRGRGDRLYRHVGRALTELGHGDVHVSRDGAPRRKRRVGEPSARAVDFPKIVAPRGSRSRPRGRFTLRRR